MTCVPTDDTGLIPAEAMLEVAKVLWESKPSGEAFSLGEQVKLSEELLNYRQRANKGLMSFQDFTAWHSRISQVFLHHANVAHETTLPPTCARAKFRRVHYAVVWG